MSADTYWDSLFTNSGWDDLFADEKKYALVELHSLVVRQMRRLRASGARNILDLGCGVARHLVLLNRNGFRALGLRAAQRERFLSNIQQCLSPLLIGPDHYLSPIFQGGVLMGFLGDCVAGSLMDFFMGRRAFSAQRADLLKDIAGEVLEIGFGTGLNLPHYTPKVTRLTIVDPAEFLPKRVAARISAVPFPVERVQLSAERLPFDDHRFDYVVSTWTLCTIPNVTAALREVRRVLKPEGRFVFLEHGRSENGPTACWLDRLNPIQNLIGGGCNLNRKIDELITAAGLRIQRLDRYHMAGPRPWTEMYRGTATVGANK